MQTKATIARDRVWLDALSISAKRNDENPVVFADLVLAEFDKRFPQRVETYPPGYGPMPKSK